MKYVFNSLKFYLILLLLPLFASGYPYKSNGFYDNREAILDFKSDIYIKSSSDIVVTEKIIVNATGLAIKHGIVREFPTMYHFGPFLSSTGFDVISVARDGVPIIYTAKKGYNGVKVYLGSESQWLQTGVHTFTIKYKTNNQIGYFDNHDELFWNVTGNGWRLPIDHTEATIHLPEGAKLLDNIAYTGPSGSRGQNYTFEKKSDTEGVFNTTIGFFPKEGLSIVVSWPKGIVYKPSRWAIFNELSVASSILFLVFLGAYTFIVISRVRRYKESSSNYRINPPENLTPTAAEYLLTAHCSSNTYATALVCLESKGLIKIQKDKKKSKSVKHVYDIFPGEEKDVSSLPPEEKFLLDSFKQPWNKQGYFVIDSSMRLEINDIFKKFKGIIKDNYHDLYFKNELKNTVPVLFLSMVYVAINYATYGYIDSFILFLLGTINVSYIYYFWNYDRTVQGIAKTHELRKFRKFLKDAHKKHVMAKKKNGRNYKLYNKSDFENYPNWAFALGVTNELDKLFIYNGWYYSGHGGDGQHHGLRNLGYFQSSLNSSISSSAGIPGASSGFGGSAGSGGGGGGGGGGGF